MTTARISMIKTLAAVVALLALGVGGGYWWAHSTMMSGQPTGSASSIPTANPSAAVGGPDKPLYWYDPMLPTQHFDKPGQSPMGMQMVPKYGNEGNEGEGGGVHVSPGVVQNLGIRLGNVEKVSLKSGLRAVGSVVFDDRLVELVQARVEGYVTHLNVKAPLEHVRRGQPLATVLAPQWLEAQQEYLMLVDARSQS